MVNVVFECPQREKFIAAIQKKIEKTKEEIDHESNLHETATENDELTLDGLKLGWDALIS